MPLVLPIVIILSALALWLTLYGMQTGYQYSVGALLRFIVGMLENLKLDAWFLSVNVGDFLASRVKKIDHAMQTALGTALIQTEKPIVKFFHWMAFLVTGLGATIEQGATATFDALYHLRHVTIPHALRAANALAVKEAAKLRAAVNHSIHALNTAIHAAEHTITVTLPREIAQAEAKVGRTAKQIARSNRRITTLEKALGLTALAGLAIKALSKRGFGCFFGRNGKTLGKQLCNVDPDFLDGLLAGALLLVGTVSLVEFAKEVGTVTEEASGLIHGFLRDA